VPGRSGPACNRYYLNLITNAIEAMGAASADEEPGTVHQHPVTNPMACQVECARISGSRLRAGDLFERVFSGGLLHDEAWAVLGGWACRFCSVSIIEAHGGPIVGRARTCPRGASFQFALAGRSQNTLAS